MNKVLVPEYLDADQTLKSSNTDWYDEISQTGIAKSYDLAVSNGSERGNYVIFSWVIIDNEGVVKTTEFERISARMNGSYKYFDGKLVIGENFSFNRTNEVTDPGVLRSGTSRFAYNSSSYRGRKRLGRTSWRNERQTKSCSAY